MTTNSTRRDSPLPPSDATSDARIRLLPLWVAIAVMLGITAWPGALANAEGVADHGAAMALFWSMSAGFVSGVGFRPRLLALRLLFSPAACLFALALAGWLAGVDCMTATRGSASSALLKQKFLNKY